MSHEPWSHEPQATRKDHEPDTRDHPAARRAPENAELQREAVRKITDAHPDMDWDDAYAIRDAIRARKEARGTRIAGLKMGLTSFAKMRQMG